MTLLVLVIEPNLNLDVASHCGPPATPWLAIASRCHRTVALTVAGLCMQVYLSGRGVIFLFPSVYLLKLNPPEIVLCAPRPSSIIELEYVS